MILFIIIYIGINRGIEILFNVIIWYLGRKFRNVRIIFFYNVYKVYLYGKNNGKCLLD